MRKWRGSITVEAVFLIPMIIVIVMIFLWLTFFLHDRLVARSMMHQTLECAGDYFIYGTLPESGDLSESDMINRGIFYGMATLSPGEEERLEEYVKELLNGKLYLYQLEEVSLEKSGFTLRLEVQFVCPLFWNGNAKRGEWLLLMQASRSCMVREELTRIGSNLIRLKDGEWSWK